MKLGKLVTGGKLENSHKNMEIKQYIPEQPMSQGRRQREIEKYFETDNGNTTYKNVWDAVKVILRATVIAINAYIKKEERSQITT